MDRTHCNSGRAARAFTLAEIIVSIFIIFLLMGIALVSYRAATNQARSVADRALVNGLKIAAQDFQREFGILPPLVKDRGSNGQSIPLISIDGVIIPSVFSPVIPADMLVLRAETDTIPRFSTYSLAYYLAGALEAEVDGVDGPGFVEVRRAGNFAPVVEPKTVTGRDGSDVPLARRGPKKYEPLFDTNRGGVELYVDNRNRANVGGAPGVISGNQIVYRTEIRDRNGVPVRYYRWYADDVDLATITGGVGAYTDDAVDFTDSVSGLIAYLNIPKDVLHGFGDPLDPLFEVPADLREATFAIVAAGPNRLFGDGVEGELLGDGDATTLQQYAEFLGLSVTRLQSDAGYRASALELARADNIIEVGS